MAFSARNPRDWAMALPEIVRLVWGVARDDRVPRWIRYGLLGVAGYLVLPFDVVPDWVPFAGQLDDVLVVTLGVRELLRRVPEPILLEHWSGRVDTLGGILGRDLAGRRG